MTSAPTSTGGPTRRALLRAAAVAGAAGPLLAGPVAGSEPPDAEIAYSPDAPKPGEAVTFDGSGSTDDGSIERYRWFIDQQNVATGVSFTHSFAAEGDYQVSLEVTDDEGNEDVETVSIRVFNEPPRPSFDWTPAFPGTGEAVTFDGSNTYDPDGTVERYTWFVDGAVAGNGATYSHTFESEGDHEVTLEAADDGGKEAKRTETVPVGNAAPTATFDYRPAHPAPGEPVYFDGSGSTDPDGTVADYEWAIDGEPLGGGSTPAYVNYTFETSDRYEVSLTVVDDDGRSATTTRTVTVSRGTPTPTGTPSPTPSPTPSSSPTTTPGPTTGAGPETTEGRRVTLPGFDVVAALAGVGGAALLRRLRGDDE